MKIWKKLGQRMCIGFEGTVVSDDLRRLVSQYKIGNVILFRSNLVSAKQARALCEEIQRLVRGETGQDAFITIDQEGGMVARLPGDMVTPPGAMALAATGDPGAACEAAGLTAAELLRIGVSFNLAPVLDVNSNGDNPVIGVRSYGDTPQTVVDFASEAVCAYEQSGVLCAGKHFPGHGDTHLDSHIALPTVGKTRAQLDQVELAAFRGVVARGIPAIMSSHILFPALEPENLPATMSRRIITGLLRQEMGFEGLVLSDGMEMGAIREFYGTPQGCVRALQAGVDIVFVCHDPTLMEQSMVALRAAYDAGELDAAENEVSVARILAAKQRYGQAFARHAKDIQAEGENGVEQRHARNAALMRRTLTPYPAWTPVDLGASPFVAGPLAYRSTIASTAPDTSLRFADWFAGALGGQGLDMPQQPTETDIRQAVERARGATGLLLATYNGHLNPAQLAYVNALTAQAGAWGIPAVAVALRNPYDLKYVEGATLRLAAYEYSENAFQAVAGALRGEYVPHGRLSVAL